MINNWNTSLYDEKHSFVWQRGADLLPLLDAKLGERILDLGCGTGHLSDRISQSGAIVFGIDSSPQMIAQARQCYPQLNFEVVDGEYLPYNAEFDAVFSNAALHWMTQPERVIAGLWRSIKPGGRFVAELGGQGNVGTIIEALNQVLVMAGYPDPAIDNLWYFPSIGEYTTLLEKQGFDVTLALLFDRSTPLDSQEGMQNWLAMFAAPLLREIPPEQKPKILAAIELQLHPHLYRDGIWYADYRRLRIVATKPLARQKCLIH
jgi:trans-aconitate methyltransferase